MGNLKFFAKTLRINKPSITDKIVIADKFHELFIIVGSNLTAKPPFNKNFDSYLPHISTLLTNNSINEEKFKKSFGLLKHNKTAGYDNKNINVIMKTYEELKTSLMGIFNLPLRTGIFPDKLKIAKVPPILESSKKDFTTLSTNSPSVFLKKF